MSSIERILIVYSTYKEADDSGTRPKDMHAVEAIVNEHEMPGSSLRTKAYIYEASKSTMAGETLSSEIRDAMRASLGAIVFLDAIRPNVAYELGFFHGQGKPVLLLTRKKRQEVWDMLSDLTGAALHAYEDHVPMDVVKDYIARLYSELSLVEPWNTDELPSPTTNLLNTAFAKDLGELNDGPYGKVLDVPRWDGVNIPVGLNLLPDSKFKVVSKSSWSSSNQTMYFLLRYTTLSGEQKDIWAGLSSTASLTYAQSNERTLPMPRATSEWQLTSGRFKDLLRTGMLLDVLRVDHLHQVRFRGGTNEKDEPMQIGFFQIVGGLQ